MSQFNELSAHFSPDGRWIAYATNESGRLEVVVRSWPSGDCRLQLSTDGGSLPQWDASAKAVYYVDLKGRLMKVRVSEAGPTLRADAPQALFQTPLSSATTSPGHLYDVSADGKRFVLYTESDQNGLSQHLDLVLDWTSELKK